MNPSRRCCKNRSSRSHIPALAVGLAMAGWLQPLIACGKLAAMSPVAATVQLSDEELAAKVAAREDGADAARDAKQSFELLYCRHDRLLKAFLSSRASRNQIDDLSQDVWHKVWDKLPTQFHGGNFRAWLYEVARHHLIDSHRKKKPTGLPEEFDAADGRTLTADKIALEQEQLLILEECLKKLHNGVAELVRSRLRGEDYASICPRFNIDEARAHKLIFNAKKSLADCVQGVRK